ncbi:MAG: FAD-dependent monooxygenase, partial [Bdellovibrionales bacterium]|nr:FAD-dependent monooxygenase [Bdellovibrionales bacterium]
INRKAFQLTLQERTLGFSNIRLYTVGECEFTQSARYLVDATGRRSVLANQLGSSRHYFDKQIALVAVFHTPKACDSERHILIESTPSGWWYSSHLPENRRVVMFFTDGDLISTEKRSLSQTLQQRLRETDHTSRILYQYDYQPCFDPWVERAGNSIQNRIAGGNWLSVGDAAATFNPITAQGLITAFRFVLKAREALALAIRAGSPISLHYHNAYREHFTKICKLQFELFQQETRWPKSTYWKRRQCKLQDSFTLNESAVAS